MKKSMKILIIAVVAIIVLAVIGVAISMNSKPKTNLEPVNSSDDLIALVEKIYEGQTMEMPRLMSQEIDLTDNDAVKAITGLENANDLQYVVASEPMMSAQAYSLVLVKVKEGVDPEQIASTMKDNIDTRKWICVSAEKVYATSSGDIVCLVMSSEEMAKPVYEKFKELAGNVGQEYEKAEEQPELPEDIVY